MPETTPKSLADVAAATSTANAMAVSRGPGAVPVYDANIAWDPSNRRQTLVGQAIGAGGDRWRVRDNASRDLVKVDLDGALHRDLTNTSENQRAFVWRPDLVNPVFSLGSNTTQNPGGTFNPVAAFGFNCQGAGNPFDTGQPGCRMAMEGNWENIAGALQFEWHWSAFWPDGFETRPITAETTKVARGSLFKVNCSSISYNNEDLSKSLRTTNLLPDGSYVDTIFNGANPDGSGGFPLQFTDDASGDATLSLGRTTSSPTTLNLAGTSSRLLAGVGGQVAIGQADVTLGVRLAVTTSSDAVGQRIQLVSGQTQDAFQVLAFGGGSLVQFGNGGGLVLNTGAGVNAAINLTGSSASSCIRIKNNDFVQILDTGGTPRIALGISTDNNTYLAAPPASQARLAILSDAGAGAGLAPGSAWLVNLASPGASAGQLEVKARNGTDPAIVAYPSASGTAMFSVGATGNTAVGGSLSVGGGTAIAKVLSSTAVLDFGSVAAGASAELTISVTGAVVGASVLLGPPASLDAGLAWGGRVSAADTVTVRLINATAAPIDPASATWRATAVNF